jgi:serine/threonine protein kinase
MRGIRAAYAVIFFVSIGILLFGGKAGAQPAIGIITVSNALFAVVVGLVVFSGAPRVSGQSQMKSPRDSRKDRSKPLDVGRPENNPLDAKSRLGCDLIGDDYEVRCVLGKGGFGIVYLIYSRAADSFFALKTFRDEYLDDPDTRARFKEEAQIWVHLDSHPNLVRAYFVDQIKRRLYVGMEFVAPDEKGINTLEGYLAHQPLALERSLRWAIQFCSGMEHAYSKGILNHGDIKPANIMITRNGDLKITDFGLSRALHGLEGSGETSNGDEKGLERLTLISDGRSRRIAGTPPWMAPEQFEGTADARSDMYSFGVVLYQMEHGGQLPFHAMSIEGYFYSHLNDPVPKTDSTLAPIIERCLQKSPETLRLDLEKLYFETVGEHVPTQHPDIELDAIALS